MPAAHFSRQLSKRYLMKNKITVVLFFCLFLSSCSYHHSYPTNWQPFMLPVSTACSNITGKYTNSGESDNQQYKPNLAWYIFRNSAPIEKITHVEFLQESNNSLKIVLWGGDNILFTRILNNDLNEFTCEKGFIKINTREYLNREGVLGTEWSDLYLTKSNNYLIVKNENWCDRNPFHCACHCIRNQLVSV